MANLCGSRGTLTFGANAESAHHRHHRAGRLVPGRAAAAKGYEVHGIVRRSQLVQHRRGSTTSTTTRTSRTYRLRAASTAISTTRRRSQRVARDASSRTRSTTSARRATSRVELRHPGVHGRGRRRSGRCGCSRRSATLGMPAAVLPGVVERDVRQGRRDAADGDDAVPSRAARTRARRCTRTS